MGDLGLQNCDFPWAFMEAILQVILPGQLHLSSVCCKNRLGEHGGWFMAQANAHLWALPLAVENHRCETESSKT